MIIINARGARTLNDARPLIHNGQKVYVTVSENEATLFFGGEVIAVRDPREIVGMKDAQDWAYEMIETANARVAPTAEEVQAVPGVTTADYAAAVHGPAAAQVRAQAVEVLAEADQKDAKARTMAARPTKADRRNPRHPANRAARIQAHADHLRRTATILAAWTAEDEMNYNAYVSDGIGATDGYFAPENRTAWKHLSA